MGSHHKRNEGMKPIRRMAAKPKPEKKAKSKILDARGQAIFDIQQHMLDMLANHFQEVLDDAKYEQKLQAIKGHFFRREYAQVFGDAESCVIYAVRYLPSRALAYAEIFSQPPLVELLYPTPVPRRPSEPKPDLRKLKRRKIVAVGAGVGSEICALNLLPKLCRLDVDEEDEDMNDVLNQSLEIDVVDSAPYADFLQALNQECDRDDLQDERPPAVKHTYHRQNILQWASQPEFADLLQGTTLLTFMFVFNELFGESKLMTMQLIAAIAKNLPSGSHVLLLESAGELSQVKVGATTQRTVNFAVPETAANDEQAQTTGMMVYKFWDHLPGFEKVLSEDRRWFRIDENLKYALEMENVGYFIRLYRKL